MIKTGLMGASGYTGGELLRLLSRHPSIEVAWATSRQYAGREAAEVFPHLRDFTSIVMSEPDVGKIPSGLEAVFVALPHTSAAAVVPHLLEKGLKVVDLSADFRLDDPEVYAEWYGADHEAPALLEEAVYGLTEWNRDAIVSARLVANPGCYPTAALLALLPLARAGLLTGDGVIVDAKSGVSGAGRSPLQKTLFCEVVEGLSAYNAARHRHIPEIGQELKKAAGCPVPLTFTPHLVPLSRGMLETIYLRLPADASLETVEKAYGEAYEGETFVKVLPRASLPGIRDTAGTNLCRIGFTDDPQGGRIIIVSVIDNLVKGASGQAVQNLNLMLGLPEGTGLDFPGLFP
jgi:N-acetyl-gamma-glutamyl-phosphate reductase